MIIIFKDNYIEAFKSNMLSIIKQGIEIKGGLFMKRIFFLFYILMFFIL
jgi:hypothetical protein